MLFIISGSGRKIGKMRCNIYKILFNIVSDTYYIFYLLYILIVFMIENCELMEQQFIFT